MSLALRNPDRDMIHAAQRLLDANPDRPEDRIRQDIGRLLDSLGIDNFLTYRTPAGRPTSSCRTGEYSLRPRAPAWRTIRTMCRHGRTPRHRSSSSDVI